MAFIIEKVGRKEKCRSSFFRQKRYSSSDGRCIQEPGWERAILCSPGGRLIEIVTPKQESQEKKEREHFPLGNKEKGMKTVTPGEGR